MAHTHLLLQRSKDFFFHFFTAIVSSVASALEHSAGGEALQLKVEGVGSFGRRVRAGWVLAERAVPVGGRCVRKSSWKFGGRVDSWRFSFHPSDQNSRDLGTFDRRPGRLHRLWPERKRRSKLPWRHNSTYQNPETLRDQTTLFWFLSSIRSCFFSPQIPSKPNPLEHP